MDQLPAEQIEIYVRNDRGFHGYGKPFTDSYGATIEVYESSSAEGPRVWVSVDGDGLDNNAGLMHLSADQARSLIVRLQAWMNEIPDTWEPGKLLGFKKDSTLGDE